MFLLSALEHDTSIASLINDCTDRGPLEPVNHGSEIKIGRAAMRKTYNPLLTSSIEGSRGRPLRSHPPQNWEHQKPKLENSTNNQAQHEWNSLHLPEHYWIQAWTWRKGSTHFFTWTSPAVLSTDVTSRTGISNTPPLPQSYVNHPTQLSSPQSASGLRWYAKHASSKQYWHPCMMISRVKLETYSCSLIGKRIDMSDSARLVTPLQVVDDSIRPPRSATSTTSAKRSSTRLLQYKIAYYMDSSRAPRTNSGRVQSSWKQIITYFPHKQTAVIKVVRRDHHIPGLKSQRCQHNANWIKLCSWSESYPAFNNYLFQSIFEIGKEVDRIIRTRKSDKINTVDNGSCLRHVRVFTHIGHQTPCLQRFFVAAYDRTVDIFCFNALKKKATTAPLNSTISSTSDNRQSFDAVTSFRNPFTIAA